ncbi:hypothetical protein AJ80_04553 [Polytolypa hystricis UAMH7299]|uniref:Non-reducing polyketide synthase nscA n=1 Tax=Polytolypa hystricis (strain UAMH7299) TaxID=1447883 RepID=A0A2B7Y9G4_POLH7|nr:hypothetical protein AJ80_04553 [Polytolypa hystricis UAMH7299]
MAPEPIAIIGTGCRFVGSSSSPSRLWDLLCNPRDVASKPPLSRFNIDGYYHPDAAHHGTTNTREAYFLSEDIKLFDASFFNIASSEAHSIDPQQRLLLETVYESLETAGLRLEALQGSSTGVFCGVMTNDWEQVMALDNTMIPQYASTGMARNNLANRVSYFFDWHGPSMTIDTACSSSLVALHQAVTALHQGECAVAAAVGVNIIMAPLMFIATSNLYMLSPNGRCRMWDADADGYARGDGVASVILKRLSDAIADGDPIECVIRGSGVNQDGRSMGLTMPSSIAQLELIRSTYARAGLDPSNRPEDRCQYFEAHGTGTQAGDPQEASAIYQAFFNENDRVAQDDILHVGSIKTIIGHTEGTAGLAGVIKASLCIQHGVITPNLHFNQLNPQLNPFASRLKIPTEIIPWPQLASGAPRRVSVNSFGFGGTNAHAIVESYEPSLHNSGIPSPNTRKKGLPPSLLPFTFSAASERALDAVLDSYKTYLKSNPQVEHTDLAWSLLQKCSALTYRLAFSASCIAALESQIKEEVSLRKDKKPSTIVSRPSTKRKRIVGIFTGQGAQWPQMCLDLMIASPDALAWLGELQTALDELPAEYRPDFSLIDELSAPIPGSRLHEAIISQPLCTAVQIILVNFLSVLGISFEAVVGHSSGEIAAAYAAGHLTARDAIRIAYLRGRVTCYAGANGQPGSMLAAGLSLEEATSLCAQPEFAGRIVVAACNSPSSVTLSGDADAIQRVEQQLKSEERFARKLRVDKAYHSLHMTPCSTPYLKALNACRIQLGDPNPTAWYSSVYGGQNIADPCYSTALVGEYWVDNMMKPVLFAQAMSTAITTSDSPPDLIVEVGPHPALKGPVLQTVTDALPSSIGIPYVNIATRGVSGFESFGAAIGLFWAYLGPEVIDPARYVKLFDPTRKLSFVKNLPSYPFDHSQAYWFETRKSRVKLQRRASPHPLLGSLSAETVEDEYRWRNFLRREEIKWLDGHKIQGQTIFPATGYIAMALEAAHIISGQRPMRLVQIQQLTINQAIAFTNDDSNGVETLVRVDIIESDRDKASGTFSCHATIGEILKTCATGKLTLTWGEQEPDLLPLRPPSSAKMLAVDVDEFYWNLEKLGYGYTGLFHGITALERKLDVARGLIMNEGNIDPHSRFLLHPAVLDSGLQAFLGAIGAPGDGQLSSLHIPTRIESVAINPTFCGQAGAATIGDSLAVESYLTNAGKEGMSGDVALFTLNGQCILRFEDVHVSPLIPRSPVDDQALFTEVIWGPLHPDARTQHPSISTKWISKIELCELVPFIYIKEVVGQLTAEDRANFDWHRSRMVAYMDRVISLTREGRHPVCRQEWFECSVEDLPSLLKQSPCPVFAEVMECVGTNLLTFFRGKVGAAIMLEAVRKNDLLTRFYRDEIETRHKNEHLGGVVKQITFRYPRMKILEIGAGTGSATREVLARINRSYYSYTFTDISAGFFENAQVDFEEHADQFIYKVLDIERDPAEQGFEVEAYDLVIAANVLHATRFLENTMTQTRRLVKSGGYLVVLEITNKDIIRNTFTVGGFEGWWVGEHDGRVWGPMLSTAEWHELLQKTGFSGLDTVNTADHPVLSAYSVFVSQAIDDQVRLLNEPLKCSSQSSTTELLRKYDDLILVGGVTERTSHLVPELQQLLKPYFCRMIHSQTLGHLELQDAARATVIVLADVDAPCFQEMTVTKFDALKRLIEVSRKLMWVTAGSPADNPYLGMSRGFIKCMNSEYKHSMQQYFNIIDWSAADATLLATNLMRLAHTDIDNDYGLSTCVLTTEFDVRLEDGIMRIPRLLLEPASNTRYAAGKRTIYKQIEAQRSVIRVVESGAGQYELVEEIEQPTRDKATNHDSSTVKIRVQYSTSSAIKQDGAGFLSLVVGQHAQTRVRLVALSASHASVISTMSSCYDKVPKDIPEGEEATFLKAVVAGLLATYLVQQTKPETGLWVHGADDMLRRAVWIQAVANGIQVYFSTSKQSSRKSTPSCLFLHERSSLREFARLMPKNVSAMANFDETVDGIFSRVELLLGHDITKLDVRNLYRSSPLLAKKFDSDSVSKSFRRATVMASQLVDLDQPVNTLAVEQLCGEPALDGRLEIVDWAQACQLPVRIQPASSQVELSANKTYLLIGMTGNLGQSICHWMITRGARNVVLTSRNPKVDQQWVEQMSSLGAQVIIRSMDVTDRESVLRVDCAIHKYLPPVGGVVNGAMVLQDQLLADMTLETMQSQFRPKVQGSILVEELYGKNDLDFFIVFGSATGIVGNLGQSAYAAATNFLSDFIWRRREQKLVGSIIHPGQIRGIGYLSRMGSELTRAISSTVSTHVLSERDLHEAFAEAILAGHPLSGKNPEVIAGISMEDPVESPSIFWFRDPKGWGLIDHSMRSTTCSQPTNQLLPIKEQLGSAKSICEVSEIVAEGLCAKIGHQLHLSNPVMPDTRLTELGVDSLVAVDLRTWFVKELEVDMPVLEILGGASISELANKAVSKISLSLLPSMEQEDGGGKLLRDHQRSAENSLGVH